MLKRLNAEPFVLLAGDLVLLALSLWGALFLRFREIPPGLRLSLHAAPFILVFAIWVVVFFIFDLYGKQRVAFRRKMFETLFRAQMLAGLLSAFAFYLLPLVLRITPRTVLFLFTLVSFLALLLWRLLLFPLVYRTRRERGVFLSSRLEFQELSFELRHNPKYGIDLVDIRDPRTFIANNITVVILDLEGVEFASHAELFYKLALEGVRFIDARVLYEEIFDRAPLSLLDEGWFLQNISGGRKAFYDTAKRVMDIVIALPLFLVSLLLYPFVALAIKLEDRGPLFVSQERIGKNGHPFKMYKFRSMTGNDSGNYGSGGSTTLHVTRVGSFLRKSRIDEVPQLLSVLRGDQSLVGPRPELPSLVEVYRREISYYDVRHIIKPGMSGWAQIYHEHHPHHGTATEQTRDKLSYDLYYVKHRSFTLDLKIALKTLKTLVSFVGR